MGGEDIGDFNANPPTTHGAVGVPTRAGIAIVHVKKHCIAKESSKPSKLPKLVTRTKPKKWALNPKFPKQTIKIEPTIYENVRTFL